MLEKLRQRSAEEEGFTLVELLVVMLILGILAAIAIPSFFAQRDKATDADAKATAKTAQTAIETFATENNAGSYALASAAALETIEPTLDATELTVAATASTYSVGAESSRSGTQVFTINRLTNGNTTQTCTAGAGGGCSSTNTW